ALADFIQLPLTAATMTGWLAIPAEAADVVVDLAAAAIVAGLLGFHWAFLPTFLLEAVPFVDVLPTWTGCVAFVVWGRRNEMAKRAPDTPPSRSTAQTNGPGEVIDVEATVSPVAHQDRFTR
ncbi:MAG TPA: hypothetical protein VHH73_00035, partial [Verrucomicrobiae bacterium]|nr:hypothetical protein [Verrucomicrobiae bacterium]